MRLSGEFGIEVAFDVCAVLQGSGDGGTIGHEEDEAVWLLVAVPWDIPELEPVEIGAASHLISAGQSAGCLAVFVT